MKKISFTMKNTTILFAVFIGMVLLSCNNHHQAQAETDSEVKDTIVKVKTDSRKEALSRFLSKFQLLPDSDLVLNFILTGQEPKMGLDPNSSDSLFSGIDRGLIYGMLHDTSMYYGLLYYAPADAPALSILVLDKNGMVKADTMLQTGLCGSDCGYLWSGKVYINRDHSIFVRDTVLTFFCDHASPPDDLSLWKHEATTVICKINPDGKLIFSSRKTVEFK